MLLRLSKTQKVNIIAFYKKLCIFLVIAWIIISFSRLCYDISHVFTDEKFIVTMTREEREDYYYGDISQVNKFLQKKKPSCVFLLSENFESYYLLRYLLYPIKIYWQNSSDSVQHAHEASCSLLVLYHPQEFSKTTKKLQNQYSQKFIIMTIRKNNKITQIYQL